MHTIIMTNPLPLVALSGLLVSRAPLPSDLRARGALLGLAWGDALGAPVEGWDAARIRRVHGTYRDLPTRQPWARLGSEGCSVLSRLRPLGAYTDDTQLALALGLTAVSPGAKPGSGLGPGPHWSVAMWVEFLVEGQRRHAWRGTGARFREAVERLARGVDPRTSGAASAGVGAAMRVAPLGVLARGDEAWLRRATFTSSLVTHADIRAAGLSYAVAWAVDALTRGVPRGDVAGALPQRLRDAESEWLHGHADWVMDRRPGHMLSEALEELIRRWPRDAPALQGEILRLGRRGFDDAGEPHPNHPYALLGGLHALGVGLLLDGPPRERLAELVGLGGDTDTVAAIAGSLLGARFGDGWVPRERLLESERLGAWASALARGGAAEGPEDLLARERVGTAREEAYQVLARRGCRTLLRTSAKASDNRALMGHLGGIAGRRQDGPALAATWIDGERYNTNNALIAFGGCIPSLRKRAEARAKKKPAKKKTKAKVS